MIYTYLQLFTHLFLISLISFISNIIFWSSCNIHTFECGLNYLKNAAWVISHSTCWYVSCSLKYSTRLTELRKQIFSNPSWCDLALQQFTPCLPIRGGKLQSSKNFSSSNPALPFICSSLPSPVNQQHQHRHHQHANSSSPSVNSSVIWREVCPNSFNMYASSVSSLSSSPYKSRYSMGKHEFRAASEERRSSENHTKSMFGNLKKGSNYDNFGNSSASNSSANNRKTLQTKFWSKSPTPHRQKQFNTIAAVDSRETSPFLYDRRLNKSFETANEFLDEKERQTTDPSIGNSVFRRSSTPHLHNIQYDAADDVNEYGRDSVNSTWCCGNFVKQWKKMNQNYWFAYFLFS